MSTSPAGPDAGSVYRRYVGAIMLHGLSSARACGLGASDLYALNDLELAGPMTAGELGTRAGLTTGPTTRLIDRLEQAGYVRRVPSPDDRRKLIIELTGKPARLDQVMAPARQRISEIITDYTPEQLDVLFDYFSRAATAFAETLEEQRPDAG